MKIQTIISFLYFQIDFPSGRFFRVDFHRFTGLSVTLQVLGQDFNTSHGICGNFNGLRDDDIDYYEKALNLPWKQDVNAMFPNDSLNECDGNVFSLVNHLMSATNNQKMVDGKSINFGDHFLSDSSRTR